MTATAAAVAFVVYSCKGKLAEADAIKLGETPVQKVDNMFIVQTENSIIKLRAEAPLMERYENDSLSYELFPEGILVLGYTEDGKLETEIIADNVTFLGGKGSTASDNNYVGGGSDIVTTDVSEDPFKDFASEVALGDDDLPF